MAELVGVAGSGYGEVLGPGRTGGRRARDGRVGGGPGRVESGVKVSGFVAVKPRELASSVDDHGNVLWRRSHCDGDCEGDIVMKGKPVWGLWEGPRWNLLSFEG